MIDEATIKRVETESYVDMAYLGKEFSGRRHLDVRKFARAIEQLARQEQREDVMLAIPAKHFFSTNDTPHERTRKLAWNDCCDEMLASLTAALPVAGERKEKGNE